MSNRRRKIRKSDRFYFLADSDCSHGIKRHLLFERKFMTNLDSILEKEMATHSSIFAWRIPWVEEPGRLLSIRSQRVRQD